MPYPAAPTPDCPTLARMSLSELLYQILVDRLAIPLLPQAA